MSEDLQSPLSSLTGAKQTMSTWSKVIETNEAIPEVYKSFFQTHQTLPYLVLTPPIEKFLHKTTEKLIYESGATLQILERMGSQVTLKSYPYASLHMVEVGNSLLSAWITLCGVTSAGKESSTTIEYNAASERHLVGFLNKMRPAPRETDEASFKAEKDKFDYLLALNFKFMNYGRSSLVRGENVLQILLQPEIREPAWELFGWTFYRTVSPAHLTILTDQELILIREDERGKEIRGVKYGGIWQYIPLRSLRSVGLEAPTPEWLTLTIGISPAETIQKTFAVACKPELEHFRAQVQQLISATQDVT